MICVECEINREWGFFDFETKGKQEVGDLCNFHNEIFDTSFLKEKEITK